MKRVSLKAEKRETGKKNQVVGCRESGNVPGVVYGPDQETLPVAVSHRDLERLIYDSSHGHAIIDLTIDENGKSKTVTTILKEVQLDPVQDVLLHADFYVVRMNEELDAVVSLVVVGRAPGVLVGGILEQALRDLQIRALPKDIPDGIDVDISDLEIKDSIHVSDLVVPDGVEITVPPDTLVVTVVPPKVVVEETTEEAEVAEEEPAEPEMIGHEKKEKEEGQPEKSA